MAAEARQLLQNSLAPSSWRAYAGGEAAYRRFYVRYGLAPVPASADTIIYYLADLRRGGVTLGTSRQRLAAVRHLHTRCGAAFGVGADPLVRAAIRGFPVRGDGGARQVRYDITVNQLRTLKTALGAADGGASYFLQRCLWAACCTAFYGGLRASDYLWTAPDRGLRRVDVTFSRDGTECVCALQIQKKNDSPGRPCRYTCRPQARLPARYGLCACTVAFATRGPWAERPCS